jgi:hypothetical protein
MLRAKRAMASITVGGFGKLVAALSRYTRSRVIERS